MRVAVIQMNSQDDKERNLESARELCARAVASDRPDLVMFPEMMSFMGGGDAEREAAAERIPGGDSYQTLQGLAREHGIYVHGGSFYEQAPESNKVFNTTVAFDPTGAELARYRKIHLFDITAPDGTEYRESDTVGRGGDVVTYGASGVSFGCSICYDLRFGELYRRLAKDGADVIAVPAAFTLQTGKDHWETLIRARAIECQTYVAAAAQCGSYPTPEGPRFSWGHSMIVDPWGHIVAQVSDGVGYACAEIDADYLNLVRQRVPVSRHRVLEG